MASATDRGGVLSQPFFTLGQTPVTPALLLLILGLVVATLTASWLLQRIVGRTARRLGTSREEAVEAVQRLAHYAVLAVGLGMILDAVGIDLSTLFAAGAIFAIGLGFAMQNIAQNFVSGLILLVERSIKPGDVLEVEGTFVRVRQMGIRATIARTLDDEEIIIPNSTIVQSTVKNYTLKDSICRLRASVGVVYASDMRLVRQVLERVAQAMPWRNQGKDPLVQLVEFGDSAVVFEVSVWIDDPWFMRRARSELNEAIWWAFKDEGIVIAFPQLDVHLDPAALDAVARRRADG
jgi:small-conductance mechanosensitive channel